MLYLHYFIWFVVLYYGISIVLLAFITDEIRGMYIAIFCVAILLLRVGV